MAAYRAWYNFSVSGSEAKATEMKRISLGNEGFLSIPSGFALPYAKTESYSTLKRLIDLLGALCALLFLVPFTPFIALAIKLDSPGPVFVTLPRVSAGRVVRVFKFRSMIKNAHELKPSLALFNERNDGPFFKMARDPRVTLVGRVLRKYRVDEFPQLLNVLRGELSLVGPRPHEPEEVAQYPEKWRHLLLVRAGVTGLSQVNGASSLSFEKELELDSQYLATRSFTNDFKIIGKTVSIIFTDPTAV